MFVFLQGLKFFFRLFLCMVPHRIKSIRVKKNKKMQQNGYLGRKKSFPGGGLFCFQSFLEN